MLTLVRLGPYIEVANYFKLNKISLKLIQWFAVDAQLIQLFYLAMSDFL